MKANPFLNKIFEPFFSLPVVFLHKILFIHQLVPSVKGKYFFQQKFFVYIDFKYLY